MTFVSAGEGAMERSSSTSNDGFLSTCFRIEKLRRSKSGCSRTLVWKSSAGIAVAHLQMGQGKERHKREPIADRWHLLVRRIGMYSIPFGERRG
jgi:hypothetical protein